MADRYLIVVDMQNDFVNGALGTKEAEAIKANVIKKVYDFDGKVIFTRDTHTADYLNTQEGAMLPVKHCIQGTDGWKLIDELETVREKNHFPVFEKNTFGCIALAEYLKNKFDSNEIESAELIGLCTDICVVSNALMIKAYMPELKIIIDASCCAGVTPEKHDAALATMESCQIIIHNRRSL